MFLRVTVHCRPDAILRNTDARANYESEFSVSDDEQGWGDAAVNGANAVDMAIEKLKRAKAEKEARLLRAD